MSIRLGRSRTCLRRENDLRARGAVTVWAKENSLPYVLWMRANGRKRACKTRPGACFGEPPRIAEPTLQPQGAARVADRRAFRVAVAALDAAVARARPDQ